MPFKVDRPPLGVFQWLKLYGGRGPAQLEDNVRATVDVRDNYSAPLLLCSTGVATVGALATLNDGLVLTGPPCRIRAVTCRLTVGAAPVTAGGVITVGMSIGGIPCALGSFAFNVAIATQQIEFGVPMDIVVMPGTEFYARTAGTAAGADHTIAASIILENWTGQI